MQAEGCLVFLALLHGNLALFDAASRDASTRRQAQANPTYWAYLAQRMRLTRMQKLHFRLALEVGAGAGGGCWRWKCDVVWVLPVLLVLVLCGLWW